MSDGTEHSYNRQSNTPRHHDNTPCNVQRLLLRRQLRRGYCRNFARHYLSRDRVVGSYQQRTQLGRGKNAVSLAWSRDGEILLTGRGSSSSPFFRSPSDSDSSILLYSYPHYRELGVLNVGEGSVWLLGLLPDQRILAGTHTGVLSICDLARARGGTMATRQSAPISQIKGHLGSVFAVQPIEGSELFLSSGADGTVRLFDARTLVTCTSPGSCRNVILRDPTNSMTSLASHPTNPYHFAASHGYKIGVYDLRMCGERSDNLAPFRQYHVHGGSGYGSTKRNRITHAVYNSTGSELLVNTRTVGALLFSTEGSCHNDNIDNNDNNDNTARVMVCEDQAGTGDEVLAEGAGFMGQLSCEMQSWLSDNTERERERGTLGGERERESERGTLGGEDCIASYRGHRNTRTLIKQAGFLGDDHIISGSDCGRVFIWSKRRGEVVTLLEGGARVTYSVQSHPRDPVLATNGLDNTAVRIWVPNPQVERPSASHISAIVEENERRAREEEYLVPIPNSVVLTALSAVDPGDLLAGGIL